MDYRYFFLFLSTNHLNLIIYIRKKKKFYLGVSKCPETETESSCCMWMISDLNGPPVLTLLPPHQVFCLHCGTQVKRMWTLITETAGVSPWLPEQNPPVFIQPHDQCLHVNNRPSTASFNITWRKTPAVLAQNWFCSL